MKLSTLIHTVLAVAALMLAASSYANPQSNAAQQDAFGQIGVTPSRVTPDAAQLLDPSSRQYPSSRQCQRVDTTLSEQA
ncbi:MAG: hypothetical protein AAF329_25975 [Cyanobacteria bacterium P01_A01_bin.17]